MIGNDIVDLALAKKESNWHRKCYLDKIYTKSEQTLISIAENQEEMVWNLWSRKEAVYKIYNRQTGIRAYIPLKIECFDLVEHIGKVVCFDTVYYTKTEITKNYIHTTAVLNKNDFEKIVYLNSNDNLSKRNGIPFYDITKPVSKSHHGAFERIVTLMQT